MKECPRCKEQTLDETEVLNALSRRDNRTYICSDCGTAEAMFDLAVSEYIEMAGAACRMLTGKTQARSRTEFAMRLTGAMREEEAWLDKPWDTGLTLDLMDRISRAERRVA